MNKLRIVKSLVVWILTLFLALVCLRSGLTKLPGIPGEQFWIRDFARWGYPDWFRYLVSVAELVSFAFLLFPRLASFGAILFALVMCGAIVTHYTHNETARLPFNILLLVISVIIIWARKSQSALRSKRTLG